MKPRTTACTWVTFPTGLTPGQAAPLILRGWLQRAGFACRIPLSVRLPVDMAERLTRAAQAVDVAVARTVVADVHARAKASNLIPTCCPDRDRVWETSGRATQGESLATLSADAHEYRLARGLVADARSTARAAATERHKLAVDPNAGKTAPAASVWVTINTRDNQLAHDVGLGDSRYSLQSDPRPACGAAGRNLRPDRLCGGRDLSKSEACQAILAGTIRRAIPRGHRLTDQGKVVRRRRR